MSTMDGSRERETVIGGHQQSEDFGLAGMGLRGLIDRAGPGSKGL